MPKSPSVSTSSGRNYLIVRKSGRGNPESSTQTGSDRPSTTDISSDKKGNPSFTNRIQEYMERFIYNNTYAAPQVKYITTEIDPEIEWKIRQILFCRKKGRVCSLKAFINNVLAAHLEEYADVINQLKL